MHTEHAVWPAATVSRDGMGRESFWSAYLVNEGGEAVVEGLDLLLLMGADGLDVGVDVQAHGGQEALVDCHSGDGLNVLTASATAESTTTTTTHSAAESATESATHSATHSGSAAESTADLAKGTAAGNAIAAASRATAEAAGPVGRSSRGVGDGAAVCGSRVGHGGEAFTHG